MLVDEIEDSKSGSACTTEALPPQPAGISGVYAERAPPNMVPAGDSDQNSDLSIDFKDQMQSYLQLPVKEVWGKQSSTRSRTKVQMQGVVVGRAVDLTTLKGYDELIKELEEMFEIPGELHSRNKWEIVFTDDEGDMMWLWVIIHGCFAGTSNTCAIKKIEEILAYFMLGYESS
ncbi:hypothetical protein HAX54_008969 [Datura stramonium]|uniref:Auxin-responsive protein n=1 Tax=Datura stramonium TaxID=4076 RepID=A0ABS8RWC4_DATST|nr:hypothetical protein [Datura stramonium]